MKIFKHSSETKHLRAKNENFEVLAANYEHKRKRKLAETMFIRDEKPSLNVQKESKKLGFFNWYLTLEHQTWRKEASYF